jgi:hypothetical protein
VPSSADLAPTDFLSLTAVTNGDEMESILYHSKHPKEYDEPSQGDNL